MHTQTSASAAGSIKGRPPRKISFVIVSHNEERNIRDCIESLMTIDYPRRDYEVIVVDSSTDRTKEIIQQYSDVILIHSDRKFFPVVRNMGLRLAQHEFLAFADADCIIPPSWPQRMVSRFDDARIAGIGGNAFPPAKSSFLGKCIACIGKPAGGAIGFDAEIDGDFQDVGFIGTGHSMFRREVLLEIGGFDERMQHGYEDAELCRRIRQAGYRLVYEPAVTIFHKTRDSLVSFLRWSFKRGRGAYQSRPVSISRILMSPFSLVWPLAGVTLLVVGMLTLSAIELLGLVLALAAVGNLIFGVVLRFKLFPTGTKKIRLLLQRRASIGINFLHIFLVILPLFYVDLLCINQGKFYQALQQPSRC